MSSNQAFPRAAIADTKTPLRAALLVAIGIALGSAPMARAAEPPLSYAETLRLALTRSPQIASQHAMIDAAREMAGPAGELPDPKLKFGFDNVPTGGPDAWTLNRDFMTMTKIGVMQEFPREEKRKLRSQRYERDADRGTVAVESVRLAVQRDAATAWLARRYSAEAERAIADQIAEAELAISTAGASYRAGKSSQADLIAAQSMLIDLRNRATEARAQSRRAAIALARYIGADADRPLGDAPDVDRLAFDTMRLSDVDGQPEVRLAQAQEALAATDADLARAARDPDWSAELSYAVRGSPYSNMVSLMVSIDLPTSRGTRQDREYAAKLKELDAARAMREDTRRMRAAEVASMLAEWESARAQARRIGDELLPLAAQRREAALAAYRGATGALGAVLEARRAELDARLALIQQQQATAKAWAWLQFVVPIEEGS